MGRWAVAKAILAKLEAKGFEAYLVGGCVRDLMLGRPVGDMDICTSAKPEEVQELFPKTVATGLKHGTVTVLEQGHAFEVTTFRQEEGYTDYRRPDRVHFVTSLKTDLARRDFTINAMALDLRGKLYDYFGGLRDLQLRMIRSVGQAEKRMAEDALRMLRAVRFSSQLGFAIDRHLIHTISKNVHLLEHVAMERITQEWRKLLAGPYASLGLRLFMKSGLVERIPFLWLKGELEKLSRHPLTGLKEEERWGLLLYGAPPDLRQCFLKSLRLSRAFIRSVLSMIQLMEHLVKAGLISPGTWDSLENVLRQVPIRSPKELAVDGHDLQRLFNRSPGPWIKNCLDKVFLAVIKGDVANEQKAIFSYLLEREDDEVH